MKKQNIAIIAVVAFVLAVAVGYALFSETLQINGTATAKGSFDVQFTNVGTIEADGYTPNEQGGHAKDNIATIDSEGKTLTISIDNLDYPGAYVKIPVTVTNEGTISATLKSIKQTSIGDIPSYIKITYPDLTSLQNKKLDSQQTQEFTIKVEWDSADTGDDAKSRDATANFTITLDYEQATD